MHLVAINNGHTPQCNGRGSVIYASVRIINAYGTRIAVIVNWSVAQTFIYSVITWLGYSSKGGINKVIFSTVNTAMLTCVPQGEVLITRIIRCCV